VFELISADLLFCRWCRERRCIGYRFHYFSRATPVGFVCLASSGYDIDLIINGFPTLRIIKWRGC